jgi:hypothetical protein
VSAVRELEGWTKQEMLQLTAKLKTVVQSCSNHQQQVNLQVYCTSRNGVWELTVSWVGPATDDCAVHKNAQKVSDLLQQLLVAASRC